MTADSVQGVQHPTQLRPTAAGRGVVSNFCHDSDMAKKKRRSTPKTVLRLPDLEQSKSAVLNNLITIASALLSERPQVSASRLRQRHCCTAPIHSAPRSIQPGFWRRSTDLLP